MVKLCYLHILQLQIEPQTYLSTLRRRVWCIHFTVETIVASKQDRRGHFIHPISIFFDFCVVASLNASALSSRENVPPFGMFVRFVLLLCWRGSLLFMLEYGALHADCYSVLWIRSSSSPWSWLKTKPPSERKMPLLGDRDGWASF